MGAIRERQVADLGEGDRENNVFQRAALEEQLLGQLDQTDRQGHVGQLGAIRECLLTQIGHGARHIDDLQAVAIEERVIPHRSQADRQFDLAQVGAVGERADADVGQGGRQFHRRHHLTPHKGAGADDGQTLGQLDRLDMVGVGKGLLADGGNRLTFDGVRHGHLGGAARIPGDDHRVVLDLILEIVVGCLRVTGASRQTEQHRRAKQQTEPFFHSENPPLVPYENAYAYIGIL